MPVSRKNPKRGKTKPTSQRSRKNQRAQNMIKRSEKAQSEMKNHMRRAAESMGLDIQF